MYHRFLLIFCFLIANVKLTMAQTITLTDLLSFQQGQSPAPIASYLNNAGGWISNDSVFTNVTKDYDWYKASLEEEFEPHERDRLKYRKVGSYKPVITYITLTQSNFTALKSSIQSAMTLDATLIDDPRVKMYKYSNANNVIEMIEPLQPQKGALFLYAFMVYDKSDYDSGFRIK